MKQNLFFFVAFIGLVGSTLAQNNVQGQTVRDLGVNTPATGTPAAQKYAEPPFFRRSGYGATDDGSFYDGWIKGRLSIGVTYSKFSLSDANRPAVPGQTFIGFVNELNEESANTFYPLIEYMVCDYLSVGASYMKIEASTLNYNNHLGDGTAIMEGPVVSADLTYPLLNGMLSPHIGVGMALLSGDFEEDTWWGLGYSSPSSWQYFGSPTTKKRGNYSRYVDVDDEVAPYFTIGVSYTPFSHLKLDVSYRRISVDPDCQFGYNYSGKKEQHSTGDFDLSGGFWLLSGSYVF